MKKISLGIAALLSTLAIHSAAQAGPLRDAVEYVGETVGDTAGAIGSGVKDTVKTVTGNTDPAATKKEIDTIADATLKAVLEKSASAKALYPQSYGYAVFDSRKASFLITTGKGLGVAVRKSPTERIYMHAASAGVNVGAGVQFYQGLFLFENKASFDSFVNQGWQADATAGATFGKAAAEAQAKFTNGMAYYQISETGIMLDATIAGTKYWKSKELNARE
ncbi:MAG: hypothetical protein EBZ48_08540 [Proteobacteria bacterium]|nr:hypothetical protein [Pseudomonadota bacterium]